MKNGSNWSIFLSLVPRFCTPPMVYKNYQLLFFEQGIQRPKKTSGGRFMFLQKLGFGTLACLSSPAEGLLDPWSIPKGPLISNLKSQTIILDIIQWTFWELPDLKRSGEISPHPPSWGIGLKELKALITKRPKFELGTAEKGVPLEETVSIWLSVCLCVQI